MPFIEIDGTRHLRRDILELRRQQLKEHQRDPMPTLFPLQHDVRPPLTRHAADRYREPGLFDG